MSCADYPEQPVLVPQGPVWMLGQRELGAGGFEHWQCVIYYSTPQTLVSVRRSFPGCHAERTRSSAAVAYVQKEDTRVAGTEFELGERPVNRNSAKGRLLI